MPTTRTAIGFLKQAIKPLALKLASVPAVHEMAHQAYYFPRFHEWLRTNAAPQTDTREALYQLVLDTGNLDGAIDYLEFGVFRGRTLRWWAEHNRHPQSTFVGFDSFEGLPEAWGNEPVGTYTTDGKIPDIGDARCTFVKGLFQDTVHDFVAGHRFDRPVVLHLDADLYSSTLSVLMAIGPRLKAGDVVIFDEFYDYMNEFRALENYRAAQPLSTRIIGQVGDYHQVALRVL